VKLVEAFLLWIADDVGQLASQHGSAQVVGDTDVRVRAMVVPNSV
jgi:hypothetical protein